MLNKSQVIRSFNKSAATYNEADFLQREVGDSLFSILKASNPGKILDIGCGTGIITSRLADVFPESEVIGVDVAGKMIECANRSYQKENLKFLPADADCLPLKSNSIDIIFSNLMLQWSPSIESTLSELFRVLKPQGYLFFSTLGPGSLKELSGVWAKIDPYIHVNNFADKKFLMKELIKTKFKVIEFNSAHYCRVFDNIYELMRELKMLGAHNVNRDRQKGLYGKGKFKRLEKAYEEHRDKNNKLPLSFEVYYVHAVK